MSLDLDQFPLYDPIIGRDGKSLSDIWKSFFATWSQTVSTTITENGLMPPKLTTAQRDALRTPAIGGWIYNTTTNTMQ